MNVEEIELLILHDTHHLAGQGKFIRWIFKERIRPKIDFVVKQVLIKKVQARRLGIRNEMNAVAFFGQGFAQFRGDHAAAPERRVAHNSNIDVIHSFRFES